MNLHRRILAGTALGLLMGSLGAAPLAAAPVAARQLGAMTPQTAGAPIILAQASVEELRQRLQDPNLTDEQRNAIQDQLNQLEQAPAEQPPAEQAPAEEAPAPEAPAPEAPAPEASAPEAPTAEQPAPAPEAPAEEPAPAPEAPAEAPAAEQPPANEAPAEEAPAEEAPAPEAPPAAEEAPAEPAPAEEAPAAPTEAPAAPAPEAPAAEQAPAEAPAEQAPAEQAPAPAGEAPAENTAPAAETPAGAEAPAAEQPVQAADPAQDPEGVLPENAAPVLDSAKESAPAEGAAEGQAPAEGAAQQQAAPAEPVAPPATDQEAQRQAEPVEVQPLRSMEGTRIDEQQVRSRRERREGFNVVREVGDRIVFDLGGGRIYVESNDRPRLTRRATEVYYEDLRGGWTREVVVREGGVQVITIRDQFGDVIRRSRIMPDGREYVLVYAGERDRDRPRQWRDPGRDLPPLRLTIPVSQYILDAERVRDPRGYYDFLEQPPIEPVRRLYSVDEVKYSARIRDTVRRVDLDILTFEFGSANIAESEVGKLEGVADAMQRILEKNPGETFLIEGHTDAVGSDQANLVLSDRRAESVAAALTDVFDIPPENLVTQGYGERYLKVATQERNRDNRRVAIRRITPLVAPMASAN